MKEVLVLDYGWGNLKSIQRSLEKVGARSKLSSDPRTLSKAERVVLPGVGSFKNGIQGLINSGVVQALNESIPVVCTKSYGGIYEILNYGKLGKFYKSRNHYQLSKIIEKIYINYGSTIHNLKRNEKYLNKFLNKKNFSKYDKLLEKI